jgi:2-polyprenyl-3-methyl-5-hydroxy-6-metoxy-1,4-benzoquinol methylase
MEKEDIYFHKQYFLDEKKLAEIHRLQEIEAGYLDLLLTDQTDQNVLDVGASDGYLATLRPDWEYMGIDIEPNASHVFKAIIDDIEANEQFSLIVYNHVLEHIPDFNLEIQKAVKRLKVGGYLFCATPEASTHWAYTEIAHINLFNKTIYEKLYARHGLKMFECFTLTLRPDRTEIWAVGKKVC